MRNTLLRAGFLGAFLCFALSPRCLAYSADLNSRITEAQNFWRQNGSAYWGDAIPKNPAQAQTLQSKVQLILDRLVYVSPLRGYDIRANIIPDETVNAHTEGRSIYINMGLLKAVGGREDMLAAVMAHELGHIVAHHAIQAPASMNRQLIQAGLPFLNFNKYSALAGMLVNQGIELKEASYSRAQEEEADAIGSLLIADAGYNPYSLGEFFDLESGKVSNLLPSAVSIPANFSNWQSVAQSVAYSALASSPIYKSHPPSSTRKNIIHLMAGRKYGQIPSQQLYQTNPWISNVYEIMERRRPKTHEK